MDKLGYYLAHEDFYFEDDIQSGFLFWTRPEMGRILSWLETDRPLDPKPFEAIFIDDVTRLARNLAFAILFVQGLRFHEIKLYDSKGNEYTSIQGYCLLIIMGIAAEIARTFISTQTSRGVRSAFVKKMHFPGKLYGYKKQTVDKGELPLTMDKEA